MRAQRKYGSLGPVLPRRPQPASQRCFEYVSERLCCCLRVCCCLLFVLFVLSYHDVITEAEDVTCGFAEFAEFHICLFPVLWVPCRSGLADLYAGVFSPGTVLRHGHNLVRKPCPERSGKIGTLRDSRFPAEVQQRNFF